MHGEASLQGQLVMMGQGGASQALKPPPDVGAATMGVFVYIDDVDKHYEAAKDGRRRNRPPAEGRRLRPELLGQRSRRASLVLHHAAEA